MPKVNKKETVRKYNKEWESDPKFKNWIQKTPDAIMRLNNRAHEAYCKLCRCCIRAHANDLNDHSKTKKHLSAESACPSMKGSGQSTLTNFGFKTQSQEGKARDLKIAAHIACHSSVRTVDHVGELLKDIGKNSDLGDLKLHRTKCSKLICKVLAPCMLQDLVKDIREYDSWYSIIIDESTDLTNVKYLALMVRYFSYTKSMMLTEFLGLVETPRVTADILYEEFKKYIGKVGLSLDRLLALGTDGAANLCGANHSLFALLKRNDCPNLHVVNCICHGLDKSANEAAKVLPPDLDYLLRESRNWFSHSAQRKVEYEKLFMDLNGGTKPPCLVKLAKTRWLVWYGAVKAHIEQYQALKVLFKTAATAPPRERCLTAVTLSGLHEDMSSLLFLTFLKPVLKEITDMNVVFQSSNADISQVYKDLKSMVFSLAQRILKPEAIKKRDDSKMLCLIELQALQVAILRKENYKPVELVDYGEGFWECVHKCNLPPEKLREVQMCCSDFLLKLIHELCKRLPSCIEAIEKMKAFTPSVALAAKGRPAFKDLPLTLVRDSTLNREELERQWNKLGTFTLADICPDAECFDSVDITQFWNHVWEMKNGAGQQIFKDLGRFALSALSLPLSNAVVERLFSVLGAVKDQTKEQTWI